MAVFSLVPFLWFVLTSWKSPTEITAIPPQIIPSFHWGFYRSALENYGLLKYIWNSAIVAGGTTLVSVAIGSLAAVANAVEDALTPFGVKVTSLPITPEKVVKAIKETKEI